MPKRCQKHQKHSILLSWENVKPRRFVPRAPASSTYSVWLRWSETKASNKEGSVPLIHTYGDRRGRPNRGAGDLKPLIPTLHVRPLFAGLSALYSGILPLFFFFSDFDSFSITLLSFALHFHPSSSRLPPHKSATSSAQTDALYFPPISCQFLRRAFSKKLLQPLPAPEAHSCHSHRTRLCRQEADFFYLFINLYYITAASLHRCDAEVLVR